MTDLSRLCTVCFSVKNEDGTCPGCRGDAGVFQDAKLLPIRCTVNGRYYIGKARKCNSEGVTYAAYDTVQGRPCSVREFFPVALSVRDADGINIVTLRGCETDFANCRGSFYSLWTKLMRLHGLTSLIYVYDVFAANGTIYAVYEEDEAHTLREYMLECPGGALPWEQARILLMPVLSTLGTLHTSGIIHRGINPEAFVFSRDGKLKLTDFCIEQSRSAGGDLTPELFDGYSALEQYSTMGQLGTWTDIYAFASVLCRVLIGASPIDAKTRAQNDRMMIPAQYAEKLPPYVINAIINGMELSPDKRTRNVEQFRSNLSASPAAVSASSGPYGAVPVNNRPERPQTPVQPKPAVPSSSNVPARAAVERVDSSELTSNHEEKKNKSKTALIVGLVIVVIALITVIGVLVSKYKPGTVPVDGTTAAVETVSVPSFLGFSAEQIINDTNYAGKFVFQVTEDFSDTVQKGIVIGQSIPASTVVSSGTTIILTVSSGKKTIVLPDYANYTYEQAEAVLTQQKFKVIKSFKYNDGTNPAGVVIETIPPAGSTVSEGDTIQIVIWQEVDEPDEDENTLLSGENETENESGTGTNEVLENFGDLFGE